jgi:G3E family GTPase
MKFAPPGSGRAIDPQAAAAETWQMLSGIIQAAQMIPRAQRAADASLPLTVIGGFLGAGKTTLLNRLLAAPHGRRIAVLVNDFGRIDIDAALIRSRTDDMISLANGCACCSVAGDLTKTLISLAQREEPPEAIVLEASGLADPRGIAQVALANPALRLDGLLTVVDAETLGALSSDDATRGTVLAQLSSADLVVLNKLDLVDARGRDAARAWLATLAPGRPVVDAVHGEIPVELALGLSSTRKVLEEAATAPGHAQGFDSWSLASKEPLDAARLRRFLASLPGGLLRAKGILQLSDDPAHRTVYQRVGARSSLERGDPWGDEAPSSRLVLIGPAGLLERGEIEPRFYDCRLG